MFAYEENWNVVTAEMDARGENHRDIDVFDVVSRVLGRVARSLDMGFSEVYKRVLCSSLFGRDFIISWTHRHIRYIDHTDTVLFSHCLPNRQKLESERYLPAFLIMSLN